MFNRLKVLKSMSALSAVVFVMGCAGSSREPSTVSPHSDGGTSAQSSAPLVREKVVIYMAGEEPPAIKGVHKVIGSELAKALSQSAAYTAVDRTEEVKRLIEKEIGYQMSGAVSDDEIRRIGIQYGSRYVCVAEIVEIMGAYHLDARIVEAETAEVIKVVSKPSAMRDVYQMVEVTNSAARELVQGDSR